MKRLRLLLPALILLTTITVNAQKGSEMCSARKRAMSQSSLKSLLSPGSPLHSFDVLNYEIHVNLYSNFINPYPNSFKAWEIVTFKVDSTLDQVQFNAANSSLIIDSVSLSANSYVHANDILTIALDQQYAPGSIVNVRIDYRHKNVSDGHFFADNGLVFTDCEPEGAQYWFPCWDKPSDKATVDVTAKVPDNVKLASNGRLQDSLITGDTIYYHWISRDPVSTYLVFMTAKVNYNLDIVYYQHVTDPTMFTPIRFYYNNGENPQWIEAIMPDMMTYFSTIFCEHPFEKNGFATLDGQFNWGGMENQSLTSLCQGCWGQSLVSHEFAHQWFGDMITCATWADITMNEGFATYGEALWLEHTSGYSVYKNEIDGDATSYKNNNPGWPIYNPDWAVNTPNVNDLFNGAITYNKGACVLHMLRYVMGDSLFFKGLRDYCADTVNFKYKTTTIQDFCNSMSQTYGQALNWFIDEWYKFPNHPVYQNTYNIVNLGGGNWRVKFYARQVQAGIAFFKMPLTLKIKFGANQDTVIRVMNDVNNQIFTFNFQQQPTQLVFDPNNDIVLKDGGTTVGMDESSFMPTGFFLAQNVPNPFSGSTIIQFETPCRSQVNISILDIAGKEIKVLFQGIQDAGAHEIVLNANDLAPGVYFYRMDAGNFSQSRKMLIH